ncbi:MAG: hypothetical protein PHR35_14915, partial [Kiritimatiellae bacterium]|nr:hypothetical protein [Kiritimatiellia bacterium]
MQKRPRINLLTVGVALLACAASGSVETTSAKPADAPFLFNGANYVKAWHTIKNPLLQTTLDSRGAVWVGTGRAVVSWGIEGQERANYWKDVQATVTTQGVGGSCFRIEGTNLLGSPVTQTVTVTADAVRCLYRADRPFVLR